MNDQKIHRTSSDQLKPKMDDSNSFLIHNQTSCTDNVFDLHKLNPILT